MIIDQIHDQFGKYRIGIISDNMPEIIKTAEERIVSEDLSQLPGGVFAYSNGADRFYPLNSSEQAWMSREYFEKCAKISDFTTANEYKETKERIEDACKFYELPGVSEELHKQASHEDDIDALHSLLIEMNFFIENYKKLKPFARHEKAKELLTHAYALGKQSATHDLIKHYAGEELSERYPQAFAQRMQFFNRDSPERKTLTQLQEETPKTHAIRAAKALEIFDSRTGIDRLYDNELEDPYHALLSPHKTEKHIKIDGYKLLPSHLKNFDYSSLSDELEDELINSLKFDPIETLNKVQPHIRVIVLRRVQHA